MLRSGRTVSVKDVPIVLTEGKNSFKLPLAQVRTVQGVFEVAGKPILRVEGQWSSGCYIETVTFQVAVGDAEVSLSNWDVYLGTFYVGGVAHHVFGLLQGEQMGGAL